MIRLILGLSIYILSFYTWSGVMPSFFEIQKEKSLFESEQFFPDLEQVHFIDLKKTRYIGEDQLIEEQSILDNDFYQDESFRFYNNTQYSFDEVKNKYLQAQAAQVTLNDLSISLGYGMEFILSQYQSVGYEYISSFPHDRGQSIRVFWKRKF